jgi:hypothetical protein
MNHLEIKYSELRPYVGEHAARIKEPNYDSYARKNNKFGDGVHVIYGVKKKGEEKVTEVQSIRFNASKWTVSEAKKWLKDHNWKYIKFEPATESKVFSDFLSEKLEA